MTEPHNDDAVLDLPAPAALPPAVHARLRQRVFTQLAEPDHPRVGRVPIVVAAAVVLLAVGVTVLAQSLQGQHGLIGAAGAGTTSSPVPAFDPGVAQRDLDRCWSAIVRAHKTSGVPARSAWQVVFGRHNDPDQDVIAVSAGDQHLFCETTLTSVTVSDPNARPAYAGGSGTGSLLVTPAGTVAGVVDPNWQSMVITSVSPAGSSLVRTAVMDQGMFIEFSGLPTGTGARFTVRELDPGEGVEPNIPVGGESTPPSSGRPGTGESHVELNLPHAPAPLVSVQDRPTGVADRSSVNGKLLGQCIAKSDTAVADPQSWQPGASAQKGDQTVLMARNATHYAVCARLPGPNGQAYEFTVAAGIPDSGDGIESQTMAIATSVTDPTQLLVIGFANKAVKRVQLLSPNAAPAKVTPVNGTFAFFAKRPANHATPLTLRFLGGNGNLVQQNPVVS
jgi:hypothetical protein